MRLLVGVVAWLAAFPALAATVKKVNKDKTKVLVALSKAEMATLEEDQEVVVEVGASGDRFVISGSLAKLNPVKQTVVLELEAAEPRFSKKQTIRFLSVFWNPVNAPVIQSAAQYHQYAHPFVEGAAGYFYEQLGSHVDATGEKDTFTYNGTRFLADGYMIFNPQWVGAAFGFERLDALQTSKYEQNGVSDSLSTAYSQTILKPRAWVGLPDDYRLGLEYDNYLIHQEQGSGSSQVVFDYYLAQPYLSVVQLKQSTELGFGAKYKDTGEGVDTITAGTTSIKVKSTLKMSSEVLGFYRSVSSPVFIWGLNGSVIFPERSNGAGNPLDRKFEIHETLRFKTTFENRLSDGSKLDWALFYAGAKTPANGAPERGINGGGTQLTYQTLFSGGLVLGGTMELFGGMIKTRDAVKDAAGHEIGTVGRKTAGAEASVLAFTRLDLDFSGFGKRRR
jgi:hypothetical protein